MSILFNSCHPYFSIALCPCNLCTLQYKLVAENSSQNKYFCPAWVQKWWKVILGTEEMCMRIQIVPGCTFLNMQHEVSLFWASSKMYQPAKKTVMFKRLRKLIWENLDLHISLEFFHHPFGLLALMCHDQLLIIQATTEAVPSSCQYNNTDMFFFGCFMKKTSKLITHLRIGQHSDAVILPT